MKTKKALLFWLFIMVLPIILAADPFIIDEDLQNEPLGTYLDILEDKTGTLAFEDILNNHTLKWQSSTEDVPKFGFTSSVCWARFTVDNITEQKIKWFLYQKYPLIDYLNFYIPKTDENGFDIIETGDLRPFSQRPIGHRNYVFPLTIHPKSSRTYYLRYQSLGKINIDLTIWDPALFWRHDNIETRFLWVIISACILMICYSVIVTIVSRMFFYLYYVFVVIFATLFLMALYGLGPQYLWPNAVWWANLSLPITGILTIISATHFGAAIANIKKITPFNNKVLQIFHLSGIVLIALILAVNNYRFAIAALLIFIGFCPFALCYALYVAIKLRIRTGIIWIFSFFAPLLGILSFCLMTIAVLPENVFTTYAIAVGALTQFVIMSVLLPDQLNQARLNLLNLNENLEDLVKERTSDLEESQSRLVSAQAQLVDNAHKAGMADMARDTIHNVGNIMNSIKTNLDVISTKESFQLFQSLQKANELLRKNINNLADFFTQDPKAEKLADYYLKIEEMGESETLTMQESICSLNDNVDQIINVIRAQEKYTNAEYHTEACNLSDLLGEILIQEKGNLEKDHISIVTEIKDTPPVTIQKSKLNQVISNIITNARDAMPCKQAAERQITFSMNTENGSVLLKITDTGMGIAKEHLKEIFTRSFTTDEHKNGFGLHYSANYMNEMGGNIWAESDGPGKGATFVLEFPVSEM